MLVAGRQADSLDQAIADRRNFSGAVAVIGCEMSPHRLRPAGITWMATDDMQVQLRNQIANRGEVDPGEAWFLANVRGNPHTFVDQGAAQWFGQVEKVQHRRFRYQDEPAHRCVAMQQQVAVGEPAQRPGIGGEPGVQQECGHRIGVLRECCGRPAWIKAVLPFGVDGGEGDAVDHLN